MIGQIAGHSEFPSIQRGVTQTIESIFGDEFRGDEIAPGEQIITFASVIRIQVFLWFEAYTICGE